MILRNPLDPGVGRQYRFERIKIGAGAGGEQNDRVHCGKSSRKGRKWRGDCYALSVRELVKRSDSSVSDLIEGIAWRGVPELDDEFTGHRSRITDRLQRKCDGQST